MRKIIFLLIILGTQLFSIANVQADTTVVIPLNSAKKLQNVVTVSAKGGNFTNPVAAMNSISDAAADNLYLVLIGPGIYPLTETLVLKEYVSVVGSGPQTTIIAGAISSLSGDASSAIVSGADNASIRDLSIINTGGSAYSIGIYNESASPDIRNVTVDVSGGNTNYAILNDFSSPVLKTLTVTATGGATSRAIRNNTSSPIMSDITINASGGTSANNGIFNSSSSYEMDNIRVRVAPGGTSSRAVYNLNSSTIIRHSSLEGGTAGVYVLGGGQTTRVMQSSILGGATISSGTLTCVSCDDGIATALDGTCQ